MRENLTQILSRYRRAFGDFTSGQKTVAVVGTAALLLAAFLVFRWVSAPTYAPLYTNLATSDEQAIIDQLNKDGVKYQLSDGGQTISVPSKSVYSERIALASQNLPATTTTSQSGYSILDKTSLTTSDFQQQTDYQRAVQTELDNTLEAINGVQIAIVHLAIPAQKVFTDEQAPTTASVLLKLSPSTTLSNDQVQAIVHLVSSAVENLDAKNVTVTDSDGNLLTADSDGSSSGTAATNDDETTAFENRLQTKVQDLLNTIVGPGNSTAQVAATLNFDTVTTNSQTYQNQPSYPANSQSSSSVQYSGPPLGGGAIGVVGPDGQMGDSSILGNGASGTASYSAGTSQSNNAVSQVIQAVQQAPGTVQRITASIAIDSSKLGNITQAQLQALVGNSLGIDPTRGDSVTVQPIAFNHDAATAAQKELKNAEDKANQASRLRLYRDIALGTVIALMILLAWVKARRRAKAREQATNYVVEQLRADAAARAAEIEAASPALEALEAAQSEEEVLQANLRGEVQQFAQDSPEDVAALLRGWLADRR